jgi:hypothetical protein
MLKHNRNMSLWLSNMSALAHSSKKRTPPQNSKSKPCHFTWHPHPLLPHVLPAYLINHMTHTYCHHNRSERCELKHLSIQVSCKKLTVLEHKSHNTSQRLLQHHNYEQRPLSQPFCVQALSVPSNSHNTTFTGDSLVFNGANSFLGLVTSHCLSLVEGDTNNTFFLILACNLQSTTTTYQLTLTLTCLPMDVKDGVKDTTTINRRIRLFPHKLTIA